MGNRETVPGFEHLSLHIERKATNLHDDGQNWDYCARFAVGLEHPKKLARWYVDLPYEENNELFLLSSAFPENWLPVVHQVRIQIRVSSIASP